MSQETRKRKFTKEIEDEIDNSDAKKPKYTASSCTDHDDTTQGVQAHCEPRKSAGSLTLTHQRHKMDLCTVINELEDVTDAHRLGLELGITPADLAIIELNHKGDVKRQKTEVVNTWLNQNTKPTWRAVALALKHMHQDAIAAGIEKKYQTRPVVLRMDSQQVSRIVTMVNSTLTIAQKPEVNQPAVAESLTRIRTRLTTGKVHAGTVGLTKAGKSTTLNAMLGGAYLPSSIQAQTAAEVCIAHSPDVPQGTLTGVRQKSKVGVSIASGKKPIHDAIHRMNESARMTPNRPVEYSKLTLCAPMHFLKDADVSLEISDTPGINEAGNRHICDIGGQALKELCAFVVILNLQFLQVDANSQLLSTLEKLHPDILTQLDRILILVNAYDTTFDTSGISLKPNEIPGHVFDHLSKSDVLGKVIPPDRVIPYSAMWALRAREWLADPNMLLNKSEGEFIYGTAINVLGIAGYGAQVKPLREMTWDNILKLCPLLEEFSRIQKVEEKLEEMLYRHGPRILVSGTCSDTKGEIATLKSAIYSRVQAESIGKKEAIIASQTRLSATIQSTVASYMQKVEQLPSLVSSSAETQLTATAAALENAISSEINAKVVGQLKSDLHPNKDRATVHSRICSIKTVITQPSTNEMQKSWSSAMTVTRDIQTKQVATILSQLKTELIAEVSEQERTDPAVVSLCKAVISEITQQFGQLNPATFLPVAPTFQLSLSANSITNADLEAHITAGTTKEYELKPFRQTRIKRIAGVVVSRTRVTVMKSVPHKVPVYSPNMSTISAMFTALAPQWQKEFCGKLNEAVTHSSTHVSQQAKAAINRALAQPKQAIDAALVAERAALTSSQTKVGILEGCVKELEQIVKELEQIVKELTQTLTELN